MPRIHSKLPELTPQELERFWAKIDKRGPDECWPWTAGHTGKGYGRFKAQRKHHSATRLAWAIENGQDPNDFDICHHCDNPPCCNPKHLFRGSPQDNTDDKVRKGRQSRGDQHYSRTHPEKLARGDRSGPRKHPESRPRGERHYLAKLTDKSVREIRILKAQGVAVQTLGQMYGVDGAAIQHMLDGLTWKHVI